MKLMGLEAVYCKPKTTISNPQHKVFPYLLRSVPITRVNHVWSIDITYIRMVNGFLYLAAIIDWFSRYVLSWELSNTLHNGFCIDILQRALHRYGNPEIFNSDQGAQFTADNFTAQLLTRDIKISMDGKGRAIDNVFIERLWRSVKYEEVYLKSYTTGIDAHSGLKKYFHFYNKIRTHSSLANCTPSEIYFA
jgi:putative transposase